MDQTFQDDFWEHLGESIRWPAACPSMSVLFLESFVRLHLRSLWILPAPDHPVWQEVRDRSRTPPRTPPYPPPVTPPTEFGQMIPVTPSEAFGPRTSPELLVIPGTPQSVWDTLLVKWLFSSACHFGSPITILHCLQTNLIEAIYFYPLIALAEPATSEVQSLFFTVYKQTWLKLSFLAINNLCWACHFGSAITMLHCLQTNLIEAVYFYPLVTFADCWLHMTSEVLVWHMHSLHAKTIWLDFLAPWARKKSTCDMWASLTLQLTSFLACYRHRHILWLYQHEDIFCVCVLSYAHSNPFLILVDLFMKFHPYTFVTLMDHPWGGSWGGVSTYIFIYIHDIYNIVHSWR